MSWWDGQQAGDRAQLRAGALELAELGWPVLPGTFWQGGRWAGAPDAPRGGAAPLGSRGSHSGRGSHDRATVRRRWSELPYSVLVATGDTVDMIEMPALVGRRLRARLRDAGIAVPAAAGPTGRWWFAVRSGEALRPELASRPEVSLHGRGSWVVAPPTCSEQGQVRWRTGPSDCRALPDTYDVQVALLEVLGQRPILAAVTCPGAVATGVHS